jgi:type IV secretory pathway VirB4 component
VVTPPAHRATTAALQAAYPFAAAGGLPAAGVYVGQDLHGAAFAYDPFTLYTAGAIGSPNMVVLGQLGRGKSALVKAYAWRQLAFDRQIWAIDPKGEYAGLARAAGCTPLTIHPGGSVRLNPLDPGPAADSANETQGRRLGLLASLAEGTLGRPLTPGEHAALAQALAAACRTGAVPTVPQVVDALAHPDGEAAANCHTTKKGLAAESRDAALALGRLVTGDLAGMFDGPTTPGLDLAGDVVCLDLSAVAGSTALGLLMTCATAFMHTQLTRDDRKRIVVIDEAWAVLADLGVARWMRAQWKLARRHGIQHIAVLHRLSDLDAAGDAGSEQAKLARGLVAESETRVVYGQPDAEVQTTRATLGLSDTEAELLPALGTGVALWTIGHRSFLVHHRLAPSEAALVDTDVAMTEPTP